MFRNPTVSLVAALALVLGAASSAPAQTTGPVFHYDGANLFAYVQDPGSGQSLVMLFEGNPGDLLRLNPDGTLDAYFSDARALVLLLDRNPFDPDFKILLGGPGLVTTSAHVAPDPQTDSLVATDERTRFHVQAALAESLGGETVATAFCQLVVVRQEQRIFRFEIEPID